MSKTLRPEEEWARLMIEKALGVPVVQHDDGSRPAMHDLDILHDDRSVAAVEITAAADAPSIELWNIMNSGGRWQVEGLEGGWSVALDPCARARRLKRELPGFLGQLEKLEVGEIRPGPPHGRFDGPFDPVAKELGIVNAQQSGTDYPGNIYITLELPLERSGGLVADTGDGLAEWLGEFLQEAAQRDVREKLDASGAVETHAFVLVPGFTTAPFSASELLMRNDAPLPTRAPQLPKEVTRVWAISTWSTGDGFRWSPDGGWAKFAKIVPEN
ncbi:MAG: hypothetical protein M3Q48_02625 [Actinomycetota bacterium]|nr:hypothetical protein [Actinomycetota bacterium]